MFSKRDSEFGGIIAPMALILAPLTLLFFAIAMETIMVKRRAQELRFLTEQLCAEVGERGGTALPSRAVTIFQNSLEEKISQTGLKQLDAAFLISPLEHGGPSINFGDITSEKCTKIKDSGDCKLLRSISGYESYFPPSLWNDNIDQGSSFACHLEATLPTLFSETKSIEATAVWRSSAKLARGFSFNRGLTIVIAPEVTTEAMDPRFRFHEDYDQLGDGTGPSFRTLHDPLFDFSTDPPNIQNGKRGFVLAQAGYPINFNSVNLTDSLTITGLNFNQLSLTSPLSSTRRLSNLIQRSIAIDQSAEDFPDNPELQLSDREEMMVSCMNPLIFVRNSFLATVVDLVSKHGELNREFAKDNFPGTEILMAQPYHRTASTVGGDPGLRNIPTQLVRLGDDLRTAQFQLPFVTYDAGDPSASPAPASEFGPSLGTGSDSLVHPFAENVTTNRDFRELVSSQLRYCYQLYGNKDGGSMEVLRPVPLVETTDPKLDINVATPFYNSNNPNPPIWEQFCPWGGTECSENFPGRRRLTATELVSALGAVQSCPIDAVLQGGSVCLKSAKRNARKDEITTKELRADLIAVLEYLRAPNGGRASFSPGAFPASVDPLVVSETRTTSLPSSVLLVLHQAPSTEEVPAIQNFFAPRARLASVPFTIAYFPADAVQSSPEAIQRLRDAFLVRNPSSENEQERNRINELYVFSPYLTKYNPGGDNFRYGEGDDWHNFRNYWFDKIRGTIKCQDGSGCTKEAISGIVQNAREIFYRRILAPSKPVL